MYRFFELEVARARRVSPGVQRVTFVAARPGGLGRFDSGGYDQRFKLFFARPGQESAQVPVERGEHWFAAWRAMDPAQRAYMRTYTVRQQRRETGELDVDFAVHATPGPAGAWALEARPGDRLTALGPAVADNAGIDFRPPPDTDWILLAGDETALPALAGILDRLGPRQVVRAWIEIGHGEDVQALRTDADAEITWLVRGRGPAQAEALEAARLPAGRPYAWLAGEAGRVRRLRRHLVADAGAGRGYERCRVAFTGYWRYGATEEDLIAELAAAATA